MKKTLFILCCLIKINLLMASSIHLTDLKCENLINPNGIDNTSPHFSWKIQSKDSKRQEYYEIQVATDSMQLIENKADLWYSGKTPSSTSVMVPYKGNALKSRMLCYWRVRVWNEKGEASDWSNINRFGIGVLENDKLKGDYIGLKSGDVRSPLLRKSFTANPSGVAFLHVNSLGYHEVYINGKKVDDQVLSPAVSQLDKRSLVVTYDVTNYLNQGENELVLWLGQGWYKETTFGAEYNGPVVKAEMNEMKNGKWEPILATENTWTGRESGYSDTGTWKPHQFGGERIDGRLLPRNLSTAELNKLEWFPVSTVPIKNHKATSQMSNPNRIHEMLTPKSIEPLGEDSWLIDMGKVLTGWFELRIPKLPAGHEITVNYSDYMTKDGDLEEQGESDIYITSGKAEDLFCNKFNHHAFRYVRITNLPYKPSPKQIKSYLVHGDYESAATFRCSDLDLNAIHDMVNYTMKCLTFSGYMVDCPHIEREGYGGDGNSSTQALQIMHDVSPTYMNWLQAWSDAMREEGSLPYVGPNPGITGGGPYWSGFFVFAPWRTYVNYNDPRLIERYYNEMKLWLSYVDKYTVDGLFKRWPDTSYRNWYLGDWLAPAGVDAGAQSSVDLVNNCFISECLSVLQKIAFTLDKPRDAQEFAERKAELNQLIHQTYYNSDETIYATGSQIDMSYPMLVGVVPEQLYDEVKDKLIERTINEYNNHIAVGLVGVPVLTEWATQNREVDFMYDMLKQPDYPGYLHMINNGATTTWEYWSGERSRVHNCYNGIGSWFYEAIGGIKVDEMNPGYQHIFIEPQIPQGVTWANTSKESPYGTIIVNWELKDDRQIMHITLPVGSKATVAIPAKALTCTINGEETHFDKQMLPLDSGRYDIEFNLSPDK